MARSRSCSAAPQASLSTKTAVRIPIQWRAGRNCTELVARISPDESCARSFPTKKPLARPGAISGCFLSREGRATDAVKRLFRLFLVILNDMLRFDAKPGGTNATANQRHFRILVVRERSAALRLLATRKRLGFLSSKSSVSVVARCARARNRCYYCSRRARAIQSPHDGGGELHLAFAIASAELPSWESWLPARGIAVEEKRAWESGGTSLYFRDPDRHLLERATPGTWWAY